MLEQNLSINLSQRLTLTPQLKQSIEILALSHEDLSQLIQKQVEANPFLELSKPSPFILNNTNYNSSNKQINEENEEDIFNLTTAKISYRDELYQQLNTRKINNRILALVTYLIENLNDYGYLEEDLNELLETLPKKANISLCELEEALSILQNFEPIGIGSRNTVEYFCIQLKFKATHIQNKEYKNNCLLAYYICNNYYELFCKQQYTKIAHITNIKIKEINKAIELIKSLSLYPIREIENTENNLYHITPDFFIYKNDNDEWNVEFNQNLLPKLSVNHIYAQSMNSLTSDNNDYIKQKIQEANWLIKSINQRHTTILNVASKIIKEQQAFFNYGNLAMRPLTMQSIADDLNIHVSTVSRAVKNKYIQAPNGVYPLNYFFNSKLSNDIGGYISKNNVIEHIKILIKNEDKLNPLSDQQIFIKLKQQGMLVSRRTIAKYRQNANILPSNRRKELNNNE